MQVAEAAGAGVVKTSLGDVKVEYLNRVDALLRDYRELERRLADVREEIKAAAGLKGHSISGLPTGNLPCDPTGEAVSRLEVLREREQRLLHQLADARFIIKNARPEDIELVRLFHNPKNTKVCRLTTRDKRARLDLLAGWAYQLYGDAIWADPVWQWSGDW